MTCDFLTKSAPGGTRTPNQQGRNLLLYPLSYGRSGGHSFLSRWRLRSWVPSRSGAPSPTSTIAHMSQFQIEPASRSWTTTKVVAVIVAILSAGYMLPWAIAAVRDVPHWSVFWVNLLLGWTIVGWIVALVMSLRAQPQRIVGTL